MPVNIICEDSPEHSADGFAVALPGKTGGPVEIETVSSDVVMVKQPPDTETV
jgi:hypothetical protein